MGFLTFCAAIAVFAALAYNRELVTGENMSDNTKNILLKIQYDGTNFHGWQKQPNGRTVQGEVEHVLRFIAGYDVPVNGTSRTDAGVHALGQCASFNWDNPLPTNKLANIMNRRFGVGGLGRSGLPGDIRVISAVEVPSGFHARFSCHGKTYKYVVDRSGDIFERNYVYQYGYELDHEAMRVAAKAAVGTHDFASFQTTGGIPRETTVRTVTDIAISDEGERTIIRVTGDGFLYNMVRIIVGTLLEIGTGKRSASDMEQIVADATRSSAGFTAPPQGLYLEQIYFDDEFKRGGSTCTR